METRMSRDRLFLLETPFDDPALPGQSFYCPAGIRIEGLLAAFPTLKQQVDIERVGFAKPRQPVADLIGAENQSLPVLILADDAPADIEARRRGDTRFINDSAAILEWLAARHGLPRPHP
jgi:hypothetical protein